MRPLPHERLQTSRSYSKTRPTVARAPLSPLSHLEDIQAYLAASCDVTVVNSCLEGHLKQGESRRRSGVGKGEARKRGAC